MSVYNLLDYLLLIGVVLIIGIFYSELHEGFIVPKFVGALAIITIGYFISLNYLNLRNKKLFERIAKRWGCKFEDNGVFTLRYKIYCKDMEILGTLHTTYMPENLHIKFRGKYPEITLNGRDVSSQKFTSEVLRIAERYKVRINDAILSSRGGELLITKIPHNEFILEKLLNDIHDLFSRFRV